MKKIICLGSSVTYGAASGGYSMCEYLADTLGLDVRKWAVSGTTLVDTDESSYVSRMLKEMPAAEHCDLFICQLSTNDATQNRPLGCIAEGKSKADFDTQTILSAIEFIIAAAKEKWDCPIVFYTGTRYESALYEQMVKALLTLQDKWGITVLNLWDDPDMNAVSKADYDRYMADPIHPTLAGYQEWWGPVFASLVNELI